MYRVLAGTAFLISSLTILAQMILLPMLINNVDRMRISTQQRMLVFKKTSDRVHVQLSSIRHVQDRVKREAVSAETTRCKPYEVGPPGPPGEDGADGMQGDDGLTGKMGLDARTMLEELELKCIVCPEGPRGPPGVPGLQGEPGTRGERGPPGIPGMDGVEGEAGDEGEPGPVGSSGKPGEKGVPGRSAPGGTGEPGGPGLPGAVGRAGMQGERGKRNFVYGTPGPEGRPGSNGLDGLAGNFGPRGDKGPPGEPGADAKFCPCPLELQFVKGREQHTSSRSSLAGLTKPHADGIKTVFPKALTHHAEAISSLKMPPMRAAQSFHGLPPAQSDHKTPESAVTFPPKTRAPPSPSPVTASSMVSTQPIPPPSPNNFNMSDYETAVMDGPMPVIYDDDISSIRRAPTKPTAGPSPSYDDYSVDEATKTEEKTDTKPAAVVDHAAKIKIATFPEDEKTQFRLPDGTTTTSEKMEKVTKSQEESETKTATVTTSPRTVLPGVHHLPDPISQSVEGRLTNDTSPWEGDRDKGSHANDDEYYDLDRNENNDANSQTHTTTTRRRFIYVTKRPRPAFTPQKRKALY